MQPVHHKGVGEQSTFPRGAGGLPGLSFLRSGPSNHKREVCSITGEILPFAELVIDHRCPLMEEGQQ